MVQEAAEDLWKPIDGRIILVVWALSVYKIGEGDSLQKWYMAVTNISF